MAKNENKSITIANDKQIAALELHEQQILTQCRIQAQSFAETGKLLKAIKDGKEYAAKGFDSFADYMDEACRELYPFKSTQAYKYIRVYERFGARLEQTNASLDVLDTLRDIPADFFNELSAAGELDGMTVKKAEALKKELEKANEQISFLQSAAKDNEDEVAGLERKIKELESRPTDVAVKEADPKKLEAAVKKAENALKKEHKKELESVKADYEKRIEELDKRLEEEIRIADERAEELRKQSESNGADKERVLITHYLAGAQDNLKKFVEAINTIDDPDKKAKFKNIAVGFLEQIVEELKQ